MKNIYVIKAEIKECTPWGNNKELRAGSLYFLPKAEVFLNRNRKNWEEASLWRKVNVVGKDRLGQIKHNKLSFKYLNNLRIEEIINSSSQTLEFIKKVGVFSFQENTADAELALKIVGLYEIFNSETNRII